ncbi:hypothetical protein [Streptomyces sp. NPDC002587]
MTFERFTAEARDTVTGAVAQARHAGSATVAETGPAAGGLSLISEA